MTIAEEESSKARKRHVHSSKAEGEADVPNNTLPSKKKSSNNANNTNIRQKMMKQQKQDKLQERRIAKIALQSQSPLQKLYFTLLLNLIALAIGAILYLKPELFLGSLKKKGPQWPPHHLAILYPPKISPREDLPLFFQQYAIATDENQPARDALKKVLGLRETLKPFQIYVTGWERQRMLEHYPLDEYCGTGFQQAYQSAVSIRHGEDLLHWCLLKTYQNDGFLQWNLTLERSPISLSVRVQYTDEDKLKGMAAKLVGRNRIHPSLLWLPKKRDEKVLDNDKSISHFDMNSELPSKMLPWLIQTAPNIGDYAAAVEEYMYELIMAEQEHWMILDVVCEDDEDAATLLQEKYQHRGVMGRDCLAGQACCVTYLPEMEESSRSKKLREKYGADYSSSSDSND